MNTSDRPARILGFFAASTNVAHFTEPLAPGAPQVLVVGAAPESSSRSQSPSRPSSRHAPAAPRTSCRSVT